MGGGGASYNEADTLYAESRALGLRQSNIHFALSAKRDTHIESDLIAYQAAGTPFLQSIGGERCALRPYELELWRLPRHVSKSTQLSEAL